jgi:hypothetical protein
MAVTELDDDDEDWYEDDSDDCDDVEWAPCPECGGTVHVITGKCPSCGYWLSDADRRRLFSSESKPTWLKVTAVVLLIALVAGMLGVVVGVF